MVSIVRAESCRLLTLAFPKNNNGDQNDYSAADYAILIKVFLSF